MQKKHKEKRGPVMNYMQSKIIIKNGKENRNLVSRKSKKSIWNNAYTHIMIQCYWIRKIKACLFFSSFKPSTGKKRKKKRQRVTSHGFCVYAFLSLAFTCIKIRVLNSSPLLLSLQDCDGIRLDIRINTCISTHWM